MKLFSRIPDFIKRNALHAALLIGLIFISIRGGLWAVVGTCGIVFGLCSAANLLANHNVYAFTAARLDPTKELTLPWAILLAAVYLGTMFLVCGLAAFVYFTFFT